MMQSINLHATSQQSYNSDRICLLIPSSSFPASTLRVGNVTTAKTLAVTMTTHPTIIKSNPYSDDEFEIAFSTCLRAALSPSRENARRAAA